MNLKCLIYGHDRPYVRARPEFLPISGRRKLVKAELGPCKRCGK